mmetsp:Transcript_44871/g.103803  ORF Transcript_44871/g.103803 Transcript_44871/m.103803 type:complete len:421 (-) Transcript_44871:76-1338(-)
MQAAQPEVSTKSPRVRDKAPLKDPVVSSEWKNAALRYKHFVRDHVDRKDTSFGYQARNLLSIRTIMMHTNTVWEQYEVWHVALKLLQWSFAVACMTILLVRDPAKLKVSRFADAVSFMRFFVGVLLGFFMAASMQRWWRCAGGFLDLFDAVRNLQIRLVTMGVPYDKVLLCTRYGVLSCWILTEKLEEEAVCRFEEIESKAFQFWERMSIQLTSVGPCDPMLGYATEAEIEALRCCANPAENVWLWVGMLIGDLAKEQHIPPNNGPCYGAIMAIAARAHDAIRTVKMSISMQAPYIYVNMLASLVHINNLMNATSFGFTMGSTVSMLAAWLRIHPYNASASTEELSRDAQSCMASFFFSCFGPIVYQALLVVAIRIAQPFSSEYAVIPTKAQIRSLEKCLHDQLLMNDNINWQQPSYGSQ